MTAIVNIRQELEGARAFFEEWEMEDEPGEEAILLEGDVGLVTSQG